MKETGFIRREGTSRSGRPITVVEVRTNRPIPPAKDPGYVKTIIIRQSHSSTGASKTS